MKSRHLTQGLRGGEAGRLALGLLIALGACLQAQLTELSLDADRERLLQADGTPPEDSSVILFGSFTNAEADPLSLVRDLPDPTASNILTTLRSSFVVWRLLRYTNGLDSFQTTTTPSGATKTALAGRPVYVWVFNSTNTNASNAENLQMGIFRDRKVANVFPPADETDFSVGVTLNNNPVTDDFPGAGILFGQYFSNSTAQSFRLAPLTNVETSTMGANTNFSLFTGIPFEIEVTANNGPTGFTLLTTNLPGTFSFTNHILYGTLTNATNVRIEVAATNSEGWGVRAVTNRLNLLVADLTLTASNSQTGVAGIAQTTNVAQIFASPGGAWTNLTKLPTGLSLAMDGTLSGTLWSSLAAFTILRQIDDTSTNYFRLNFNPTTPSFAIGGLQAGRLRVRLGQSVTNTNLAFSDSFEPDTVTAIVPDSLSRVQFETTTNGLTAAATNPLVQPLLLSAEIPTLSLEASKSDGTNSLTISTNLPVVVEAPSPVFSSPATNRLILVVDQAYPTNLAFLFRTDLDSRPWRPVFSASNLPAGLAISNNGIIGGAPTNRTLLWRATSSITAANSSLYHGGGTSTFSVQFLLENEPPILTAAGLTNFGAIGRSLNWSLSWANNPTNISSSGLPPGCQGVLSSDGSSFTIRGAPTADGHYPISLAGQNATEPGGGTSQSSASNVVVLFVAGSRPSNSTPFSSPDNLVVGQPLPPGGSAWVDTSAGVRVAAYGLPPGLTLDPATGRLAGTPASAGSFSATVFIQNGRGWIKKNITLTVR